MSFKNDIHKGLSQSVKRLSSKYFYDSTGDAIFQQIMEMPEYYLTKSEFEILQYAASDILKHINTADQGFELIELGAGDGYKTKLLLAHFLREEVNLRYIPIDISGNVLEGLKEDLKINFPGLEVKTENAEYFEGLNRISAYTSRQKVILFLGSNIGNFTMDAAREFLSALGRKLETGDKLLIGFDLKKNPKIILDAYNDKGGLTKKFNLNLLNRINRELGGDFEIEQFDHYPIYDPISGAAKSFLVSLRDQEVHLKVIGEKYRFSEGEVIHTEVSQKYDIEDVEELAGNCGFECIQHFFDQKHYYVDSLWEKSS